MPPISLQRCPGYHCHWSHFQLWIRPEFNFSRSYHYSSQQPALQHLYQTSFGMPRNLLHSFNYNCLWPIVRLKLLTSRFTTFTKITGLRLHFLYSFDITRTSPTAATAQAASLSNCYSDYIMVKFFNICLRVCFSVVRNSKARFNAIFVRHTLLDL